MFLLFFFFPFLRRCSVRRGCGASFIVVYIVFIWEVNYVFLHIYLEYHTETGQLIIIKQLCQKMFYLTFYIDC